MGFSTKEYTGATDRKLQNIIHQCDMKRIFRFSLAATKEGACASLILFTRSLGKKMVVRPKVTLSDHFPASDPRLMRGLGLRSI